LHSDDRRLLLFRVDQFSGVALGVLRDIDERESLVAILGINSYLFDIMPAELRAHSKVSLELNNGSDVGRFSLKRHSEFSQLVSFSNVSIRYPLHATIHVERSALQRWDNEMLWGGGEEIAHIVADVTRWRPPNAKANDLNQSRIVLKQDSTLIAVIEMSLSSWLVAGIVPGVERQPLKKLAVDESALVKLLNRWREEAEKAGRRIERITVAFEAGRDGFLAGALA